MTAGRVVVTKNKDWSTPPKYVAAVKEFFSGTIHLDPCSNKFSIVRAKTEYSLPKQDGLSASWDFPTIYVNPPYGIDHERGTSISDWLCKCNEAHRLFKSDVIALVPVATNTGHWKKFVFGKACAVCFLYDTRLKFLVDGKDGGKGAPMSCAIVYWGRKYERFFQTFIPFGAVVDIRNLQGVTIGVKSNGQASLQL